MDDYGNSPIATLFREFVKEERTKGIDIELKVS